METGSQVSKRQFQRGKGEVGYIYIYIFINKTKQVVKSIKRLLLKKTRHLGTSLVAQWLRLSAPNAGGPNSTSDQRTRSHLPLLRSRRLQ